MASERLCAAEGADHMLIEQANQRMRLQVRNIVEL